MNPELLSQLTPITAEEQTLLRGMRVDQALYASGKSFTVDAAKLLESGKLITLRPHARFAPFPRHSHNYVEIMYMCAGQTVHEINGFATITLKAGELLLLNQHASHAIAKASAEDVAVNFIVLPPFFDTAFDMIGTDNVLGRFLLGALQTSGQEVNYLHFQVQDSFPIQNIIESMVYSLIQPQANMRRINQLSMALLFLHLLNHTQDLQIQGQAPFEEPAVVAALREVEENYQSANLTRVSVQNKVSLPYLSARIKCCTGQTFKELLLQKRMEKAAHLLCETRLSVQEIITAVGYDNTSYFFRSFKAKFGVSPKEYRARLI